MRLEEKLFGATALKHGQSGGKSPDKASHAGTSHFESAFANAGRKPQPAGAQPTKDTASDPSAKLQDQATAAAGDHAVAAADDDDNDPHATLKHHVGSDGETGDDVKTRAERQPVERREERGSSREQRQPSQRDGTARHASATDTTVTKTAETKTTEPRAAFQSTAAIQSASARGAPLQTLSGQLAGQTLALLAQEPSARGIESVAVSGRVEGDPVRTDRQGQSHSEASARSGANEGSASAAKSGAMSSALSLATAAASSETKADPRPALPASVTAKPSQSSAIGASADRVAPSRTVAADLILPSSGKAGVALKEAALGAPGVAAKADPATRASRFIDAGAGLRQTQVISAGTMASSHPAQDMRLLATTSAVVRTVTASDLPSTRSVDAAAARLAATLAVTLATVQKAGSIQPSIALGQASAGNTMPDAKALPSGIATAQAAIRPLPGVSNTTPAIKAGAGDRPVQGKAATAIDAKITVAMPVSQQAVSRDIKTVEATTVGATKAVPADTKVETKTAGSGVSTQQLMGRVLHGAEKPAAATKIVAGDQTMPSVRQAEAKMPVESKTVASATTPATIRTASASVPSALLHGAGDKAAPGQARSADAKPTEARSADTRIVGTTRTPTEARVPGSVQTPQKAAGETRVVETRIAETKSETRVGEPKAAVTSTSARSLEAKGLVAALVNARVTGQSLPQVSQKAVDPVARTTPFAETQLASKTTVSTEAKPAPVLTPPARSLEAKGLVTARIAGQTSPQVSQTAADPVARRMTPFAQAQLASKITVGTEAKLSPVQTPATDTKAAKTTSFAPTALRAGMQPTQVSMATAIVSQKGTVAADPTLRATLPLAEHSDHAVSAKVALPATERGTETAKPSLARSVVASTEGVTPSVKATHHAVQNHASDGTQPRVARAAVNSVQTSANRQSAAKPGDTSGAQASVSFSAASRRTAVGTGDARAALPVAVATGSSPLEQKTTEALPDTPVKAEHPALQPEVTMPVADATPADHTVKATPVTADMPHQTLPETAKPAQDAGSDRHPVAAGAIPRPADRASASVAAKDPQDQPLTGADPAGEPLPDGTAADVSAAEALVDRLMLARSLNVASAPQPATADGANPMFSLMNAASYRPATFVAPRQAQPLQSEPVGTRSDTKTASIERLTETRDGPPATAAQPALSLPSSALSDKATEKTVALPGTDQIFRFARADGKGQALSVSLNADGDRATITPDTGGIGNRAETVTVLDSRRFLGVTPASNSEAVTSLIPSDPQWADAMRLGADPHAATGKVVNTLKIQMHPIDLGLVTATLRLKDDELYVDLKVETGDAYRQLNDDQGAMVKALRAQGFAVDQINIVYTASDSASSSGNGASQPQTGQSTGQGGRERPADGSLQGGERNGSSNGDQQGSGDRRTRREALDDGPLVNGRTRSGDVYM